MMKCISLFPIIHLLVSFQCQKAGAGLSVLFQQELRPKRIFLSKISLKVSLKGCRWKSSYTRPARLRSITLIIGIFRSLEREGVFSQATQLTSILQWGHKE